MVGLMLQWVTFRRDIAEL